MATASDVKVWDLPVRIFHWLLAIGIAAAWYTAEEGEMQLHAMIGKSLLSLSLFRLLWGLYGSETARFAHFLKGPKAVAAHLRSLIGDDYRPANGHNPAGGWMVALMLAAIAIQGMMGLFGQDDIGLFYGPLAGFVSNDMSGTITRWHHQWFDVIVGLIGIHIVAVFLYRSVKHERLIGAMITGRKPGLAGSQPILASPWLALMLAMISFGLVWGLVTLLEELARLL